MLSKSDWSSNSSFVLIFIWLVTVNLSNVPSVLSVVNTDSVLVRAKVDIGSINELTNIALNIFLIFI